jgi:hypothetical protein
VAATHVHEVRSVKLHSFNELARAVLRDSTLMDASAYGARFHAALRYAWTDYCTSRANAACSDS